MKLKHITIIRVIILTASIIMIAFELIMDTHCILNQIGHLSLYILDIILYFFLIIIESLQLYLAIKHSKNISVTKPSHICNALLHALIYFASVLLIIHITFQIYMYQTTDRAEDCYYFKSQNFMREILFIFTLLIAIFVFLDLCLLLYCICIMRKNRVPKTPQLLAYYRYMESMSENQTVIEDIFHNAQKPKFELLS